MKYLKIAAILMGIQFSGCDTMQNLNENPPHLITSNRLFTDYSGFQTGINGAYSEIRNELRDAGMPFQVFVNGTDNMTPNYISNFGVLASQWGDVNNSENNNLRNTFNWLYGIINATNTMIDRAEGENLDWNGGPGSEIENKNSVVADAKAIRAWAYRHLTYLWGDVPLSLVESSGNSIKTDWERTPVYEVREQIVADLLFAEQHIPTEPIPGRMSKGVVQHYLAEMYLVMDDPENSLHWADQVIGNPAYQLVTQRYGIHIDKPGVPFMDMFYEGNKNREEGNTEALWVWQYGFQLIGGGDNPRTRAMHLGRYMDIIIDGVQPLHITFERGGRGKAYTAPTQWFMNSYEPQDDRFSNYALRKFFILKNAEENAPFPADRLPPGYSYGDTIKLSWSEPLTLSNWEVDDWPYSRKFEGSIPDNVASDYNYDDYIAVRLADTYLLKAEAEFKLGNPVAAAETINIVRRRSNASDITAGDVNIDFILDERSRELFNEEYRRYTLLRTGKWLERTKAYNLFGGESVRERDLLFPIPQSVIDANLTAKMPQNPGF
ncbi:MAG TPA: RagB/SusD family nutrient uptake outer membrane protein [Lunatimonas sp.]|nr:RagB/SusD family nutrient uptake outer membrane protein [Lunatimonas sp.]